MVISSSEQEGPRERLKDRPVNVYPNSAGTGALSLSTVERGRFRFVKATVKFSAKPVTGEDVTLTLDANDGASFDSVERRATPSDGTGTGDVVFYGLVGDIFEKGDQLILAFTNTDGRTVGARIVVEPV